jgi:succinate dehydrogenase / fumarate reductase flavoprotein subunit
VSVNIIDQMTAQGVPFAREYGGLLANRSFGGAQVSRTFYARGQTGQQLLLGAYQQLEKEVAKGSVEMYTHHEMLDLVVADGVARGIVVRDLMSGKIRTVAAHAVLLCTGGYGNVFYLSTNAKNSNATAIWRAHKRGALFANPCYTQIHPTCIPVTGHHQSKLTLMSESLRNDGRVWVPARAGDKRPPSEIRRPSATTTSSAATRASATWRRATSRAARPRRSATRGAGSGDTGLGVYLDFADSIKRLGKKTIAERYGNLFEMYERITDEDPYKLPMRIFPAGALHDGRPLGGLQPDEHDPGLFVLGEANFSTTARTGWARRRSCRGSPTATSSSRTPSATTSPA